jgi:integrase/recombinase XerD
MELRDGDRLVLEYGGRGGCAQAHLDDFAKELWASGFTRLSIIQHTVSVCHFGRWLLGRELQLDAVTPHVLDQFTAHFPRCRCSVHHRHSFPRTLGHVRRFMAYLQRCGIALIPPVPPPAPLPEALRGFREWMQQHRGATVKTTERFERLLLGILPQLGTDPHTYTPDRLRTVLLEEGRRRGRHHARFLVTAIRAWLRFLTAEGRCRLHLDQALPTIIKWHLSEVPEHLEVDEIERVIDSCDLQSPHGVRDRAILLLLARLGLRAADIVGMRPGDIDWERGTLCVRGKGRREVCLPLPQDAGEALLDYLRRARQPVDIDRVFLCVTAPYRPFASSAAIADIVRFALRRAGITRLRSQGAHVLRHSAATAMLSAGASLEVIATVLRHRSSETTVQYAKVDRALLQAIAQPWPDGASC